MSQGNLFSQIYGYAPGSGAVVGTGITPHINYDIDTGTHGAMMAGED